MSGVTTATVIAGIGAAASLAGTAMSFMGQMNAQASAGAQQAYLAQIQRQRQQLGEQQANDAIERGKVAEQKQRALTQQRLGTQQATLAAQGTDLEGSPTDILGDTARAGEQDALTIRNNAAREAWGYKVAAVDASAQAGLRESFQPSYLGAGGSLLMGAGSLADRWSKFQWPGGGGGVTSTQVGGPDGFGGLG